MIEHGSLGKASQLTGLTFTYIERRSLIESAIGVLRTTPFKNRTFRNLVALMFIEAQKRLPNRAA